MSHIQAVRRALCSLLCLTGVAPPALAFGPDWPLPHANVRMTRVVEASGALTQPSRLWQRRLGGNKPTSLVQDVDGDGLDEVLQLVGGRLVAMDPLTGATQWATPGLALGRIVVDAQGRAQDMDGDGTVDVIVGKAHLGDTRVYAIDGETGAIHWQFGQGHGSTSGRAGGNHYFIGDGDDDGHPELLVHISASILESVVYCFDFQGGYDGEVLQWTATGLTHGGAHYLPMFDVSGNGVPELVLASKDTMLIYDGMTGALKSATGTWLDGIAPKKVLRVYPTQVDNEPAYEIATYWSHAGGWVGIYEVQPDTHMIVKRWRHDLTTPSINLRPLDFDGDGREEFVMSTYDEEASVWTTSILDGGDGEVRTSLDGVALVRSVPDLDGDGDWEILAAVTDDYPVPTFVDLQVLDWDGSATLDTRWDTPFAGVEVRSPLDLDGDGNEELLVHRDTDGDGVSDRITLIDDIGSVPIAVKELAFPKDLTRVYHRSATALTTEDDPGIVVFTSDGFLDLVNADFEPVGSRLPTGGYSPTLLAAATTEGGAVTGWVSDSLGRLLGVNTETGSSAEAPTATTLVDLPSRGEVLAVIDVDGDGAREIFALVVDGDVVSYELYEAHGAVRWSYTHEDAKPALDTEAGAGADLDGDGVLDFYLQTQAAGLRIGLPLSGADGVPLDWAWLPYQPDTYTGAPESPPVLADFDGDGHPDVLVSLRRDDVLGAAGGDPKVGGAIHALAGTDGAVLGTHDAVTEPAHLVAAEVDGDPNTVDVLLDWWGGRAAITVEPGGSIATLWQTEGPPEAPGRPIVIDTDGDGSEDLIDYDTLAGLVYLTRTADGTPLWPGDGVAVDGVRRLAGGQVYRELLAGGYEPVLGGEVVESLPWTQLRPGAVAVTDLTGQGHPSLVIGSYEGLIYAMNLTDGSLDWVYDLATEVGPIVVADTTGDGLVELLVTAGDGNLHALGQASDLGVVTEVIDGLDEDLDLVEVDTPGFGVNAYTASWTAPEGGSEPTTGYLIRLVTDTGAGVVDWEDVGDVLTTTRTTVAPLVADQLYRVALRPYGEDGTGHQLLSDGFRLDDAWFEPPAAEPTPDTSDAGDAPADRAPDIGPSPNPDATIGALEPESSSGPRAASSGCGDCAGGGPTPLDAALWGLGAAWWLRRRRRALR